MDPISEFEIKPHPEPGYFVSEKYGLVFVKKSKSRECSEYVAVCGYRNRLKYPYGDSMYLLPPHGDAHPNHARSIWYAQEDKHYYFVEFSKTNLQILEKFQIPVDKEHFLRKEEEKFRILNLTGGTCEHVPDRGRFAGEVCGDKRRVSVCHELLLDAYGGSGYESWSSYHTRNLGKLLFACDLHKRIKYYEVITPEKEPIIS